MVLVAPGPPAPPPSSAEIARTALLPTVPKKGDPPRPPMPPIDTAKPAPVAVELPKAAPPPEAGGPPPPLKPTAIDLGSPPPPPAPPTSAEVARLSPVAADPNAWPASRIDQVKAVQSLLRDMKMYAAPIDGKASAATRSAILEYERLSGLAPTGEVSQTLFRSLKEMSALMRSKN